MKKYIIPLILIFVLFLVSIGDCAWLSGYDQRIKLTTDNTKIDTANLTWFPVTVFLEGDQAEEIFSELDADSDYMKVAFTKADGTTQLYAEKELFDVSYFRIDTKKQIDTATYDAFGLLIKTGSDTIIYFFREGTSYVGDKGKIVKQVYTISTDSWGARSDVYEDANANYDSRNVGGGIIGSNIYLFFGRYNWDTAAWVDIGYIKSTDLTGGSWGSYTAISTGGTVFSPYGHLVSTATSGKYLQPFYMMDGETSSVKFFETVNSGDNWAVGDTIYSGAIKYSETCVAYIGDSKMIALMRDNDGDYVNQAVSGDNGETWGAPANTNLGASTLTKVPYIIYNSEVDEVIAIYTDRHGTATTKISQADAATVYSSFSSWRTSQDIENSNPGYPSIVKIAGNKYFFVHADLNADADTLGGIITIKIGIYHVSRDGWVIAYDADTDFYMYYDNDHADNTDYIGAINTTAGGNVWNGSFKMVQHMVDDAGDDIDDSTSNNNDGTKVNTPIEVTAQIGKGQQFVEGESDYITCGGTGDWNGATAITIECCVYDDDVTNAPHSYISKFEYGASKRQWTLEKKSLNGKIVVYLSSNGTDSYLTLSTDAISSATWTYIVFAWDKDVDSGAGKIYINGSEVAAYDTQTALTSALASKDEPVRIGRKGNNTYPRYMDGKLDENRLSHNVARSAAWIKATYNSLWDTLLTYGSEENAPAGEEANAIFFGANF